MADSFVHLHNHTEYSMLDGAARVEELVLAAKADGQSALGITDHGNMYGVIDFYETCRKNGVTPIIGLEAYMAANSRFDRPPRRGKMDDTGGDTEGGQKLYHHLTLLATSNEGYRNLRELSSRAFLEGYYYKPRLDWELLEEHASGLVATSGCLGGVVLQALLHDDYAKALELAGRLQTIFGAENFFIEMQDHGIAEQVRTNPQLLQIARDLRAPLLATNDLHYVNHSDAAMHDALLCIGTGSLVADPQRFRFSSDQHYLKSAAEMRHLFRDIPEACDNTLAIAERVDLTIEFDNNALPEFPIPAELAGATHKEGADRLLRHLSFEGARERYGDSLSPEVEQRLDYELRVVAEMGFSDYFLVVWDLIRHARERGIRVGPGRGSAAGCCVAYCLKIVDLDPIRYGLIFERFLNPGRKQMPDIDMDFDERYRGDMIRYAAERYGADHVAQIVTFSTIKARAAVRDAARVLGYPPQLGDQIAKAMPPLVMGQDLPLEACFTPMPGLESRYAEAADLRTLYETNPEVTHVIDTAKGFVDKRRQDGIHAAAVVITRGPVLDYVPVQRKASPNAPVEDAPIVTQYEATAIEKLGLLKMDFLGLRNLAIIERTLEHIRRGHGLDVDIDHVPLDDPKVFEMLQQGNSIGIFQLEGDKMRQLMRRLAPTTFDDIAALNALYRPGPLSENVHNDYADRKNHRQEVRYDHPDLQEILGETYGLMIYQENIMRVATKIAGFSMTEADDLRKACSKKIREMIQAQRTKFVEGAQREGYGRELGEAIFNKIEPFADYAFNKSHAYGYALIGYQNAWLKANYPVEYMSALLTSFRDDKDKAALYLNEARQMGITVGVPDVNESFADYAPSLTAPQTILFGMAAVRNVGEALVEKIVAEREAGGAFASIYDFVRRVDPSVLNRRTVESLIKAGAFDSLGVSRRGLLHSVDELIEVTLARRKDLSLGISTLFASLDADGANDWEGTEVAISPLEFDQSVKLDFEREMLGTYISDHPLYAVEHLLASKTDGSLVSLREQAEELAKANRPFRIGGIFSEVQLRTTKDGRAYARTVVEDLGGSVEVNFSSKVFERCSGYLAKDNVVVVKVRVDVRDEEPRFGAMDVEVVHVEQGDGELRLSFRPEDFTAPSIARLKEILQRYPGPSPVILETGLDGRAFKLGPDFSVAIASVVGDLRSEFGRNVIKA
ncbi:MAG: DNA polymerase III subunit alpha [Acidobacteriota bacterium]|nr:DNA polymerase III subunit alpha [Acidobacteriota bacterium]MDE3030442.1 DNA polymerase III subunit alpha [Acidobacteriota bacterium]MDE3092422.1 DNA polymerase III subunit alpha [Acidobacteriota bacterium]MDE3139266.1 DNA polymerase III subunit alpha [Acidobacteriota bacterium]MDE3146851.1 DNA polymerase III subunit alpha [Acidobacteriota bacterium]